MNVIEERGREEAWARELVELSMNYQAVRVLQVAHRAGVLESLGRGSKTAGDVAADRSLDAAMVEKLLIASAAMGFAARDDGGWALLEKGRATLLPDAPLYQGNTLGHMVDTTVSWYDLEAAVRGRKGGSVFSPEGPERSWSHRDFILAMHNMAMAGRAAELAARVDLSGKRRLMDIGGGPGTYTMALCERYPDLEGVVFDLPETLKIAQETIDQFGMTGRIRTQEGNWDEDEFGSANDAVLMSNVMHGPGSGAEMKLGKAYRSMPSGGVLMVQDFILNSEKTGPLRPALFNIMLGAFSVDELAGRVEAAGFSKVEYHEMPGAQGTSLVTAVK